MIRFVGFVLAVMAGGSMLSAGTPRQRQGTINWDGAGVKILPPERPPLPRFNWMMWWECARDRCFAEQLANRATTQPAAQGTAQPATTDSTQRDAVIEALRQAAAPGNPSQVRCEAVLALGRIGDKTLLPELIAWADDNSVGLYAAVAIGLIGGEEAETFLLSADRRRRQSTMAAIALLDDPGDAILDALLDAVASIDDDETRRLAVYAMCSQANAFKNREQPRQVAGGAPAPASPRQERARQILLHILRTNDNPHLAAQAAMALGGVGTGEDAELLGVIASDDDRSAQVPAARATAEYWVGVNHFIEQRPHSVLRISAAMGLTEMAAGATLRNGMSALDPLVFPWAHFSLRFRHGVGMITIAEAGGDMQKVVDFLHGKQPPHKTYDPFLTLPDYIRLRSFAAVAVGRANVSGVATNLAINNAQDATSILGNILKNKSEEDELRAACALGLGLTKGPGAATALADAARTIDAHNELMRGYLLLALAMQDDVRALDGAAELLGKRAETIDVELLLKNGAGKEPELFALLGRRAAVQALALLKDKRATPLLIGQWGQTRWIDQEVARALGQCGSFGAADALIQILSQDTRPELRTSAAASLGEMFDPSYPSRLSRLIQYTNCTVGYAAGVTSGREAQARARRLGPHNDLKGWPTPGDFFHSLANPFYFERIFHLHHWI